MAKLPIFQNKSHCLSLLWVGLTDLNSWWCDFDITKFSKCPILLLTSNGSLNHFTWILVHINNTNYKSYKIQSLISTEKIGIKNLKWVMQSRWPYWLSHFWPKYHVVSGLQKVTIKMGSSVHSAVKVTDVEERILNSLPLNFQGTPSMCFVSINITKLAIFQSHKICIWHINITNRAPSSVKKWSRPWLRHRTSNLCGISW